MAYYAPFYQPNYYQPQNRQDPAQYNQQYMPTPQQIPQPVPQAQQPQPQQSGNGLVWVQGEAGAKSYLVAPSTTVMLMDSENSVFYLKSADASGMPLPLRTFDYKERTATTPQPTAEPVNAPSVDFDQFITRDEFERRMADMAAQSAPKRQGRPPKEVKEEADNE